MINVIYIIIFYSLLIYTLFYLKKDEKSKSKFELKFNNKTSCSCKLEKFKNISNYDDVFNLILNQKKKNKTLSAQKYFEKKYKYPKIL